LHDEIQPENTTIAPQQTRSRLNLFLHCRLYWREIQKPTSKQRPTAELLNLPIESVHLRSSVVNVRLLSSAVAITLAPSIPRLLTVHTNAQIRTPSNMPLFGVITNA
jgi:hypothetical protein